MGFFRAESGGNKPSTVNNRNHIDYAGLSPNYELTDTEKSLWSKHRNHFKVNQYDDYATEGLEKGYYSLDDMYLAAIQRLVRIDSQFQEVLDSMDVKLSAKGERKYEKVKKEWMQEGANASVDWMYFHGNIGIADQETGDFTDMVTSTVVEATPEPVEEPSQPVDTETTGILGGIATAIGNLLNGGTNDDTPPPEERTMSDNEKAQIEEHIRNMDIDFKEEMRNNGVTLTKDGNNAWDKIRNAVRDGTLPLSNYNNDYLRGKLEQEGYFTQAEPTDQDPLRFGDQIQDMGKVRQDDFGGKEKPPAQPPMGGPIEYDREGRPKDMPMEEPRGNLFGGFLEMLFPPQLPEQEEEMRMKEIEREEADLSPESPEEIARKDREKDVVKTDSRFEQAHGQITQEGERAWEEVRMKYLDFGGFDYSKEVQAVIEKHRIPDPVDCVVDVAPWQDWENDCDNSGMMVRVRQRPVTTTPPRFGGEPCPPYSELPPSVEEKPCPTPVEEELPPVATIPEEEVGPSQPTKSIWEELTGWIDFGDGTITDTMPTPVQVDSGTNQDSLLPDQTTPIAPAETTPVVTEEPVQTTVVVEEPEPVDCKWGAWSEWNHGEGQGWSEWKTNARGDGQYRQRMRTRYSIISPQNGGKECACFSPNRDSKMEQYRKEMFEEGGPDAVGGSNPYKEGECLAPIEQLSDGRWREIDVQSESRATPAAEPVVEETVVVDSATTQDSLLPAQTSTPASTTETPSPTEVTVNIVQQPTSSGGGGGQTATTTTETTEDEETTTEEPEEESNALKIVGGLAVLSGIGYWAYKKYA